MASRLVELLEKVTDETTFLRFLSALREESEVPHDRRFHSYQECVESDHWETRETKDFLRSVEDWATRGDFADGVHYGEPMLKRVATMLYVGKNYRVEDRPR
jgi:hypothetical protein